MKIQRLFVSLFLLMIFISLLMSNTGCLKEPNPPGNTTFFYTNLTPDSVILQSQADTFDLDLNHDGVTDFQFLRSRTVLCDDNTLGTWAYTMELSVKPASPTNAILGTGTNNPLDSAASITADSAWTNGSVILLSGGTEATGHCITTLPVIQGNWLDISDKFLGFKLVIGNDTYYGWARLSSTYSRPPASGPRLITSGDLIVKDYAVNSIPNQPIFAGQTK